MIHTIKLISKKTSVAERTLSQAGRPETWIVKDQKEELSWSQRAGPWLYITPNNNAAYQSRWVSLTDDADFFVETIR